MKVGTRSLRNYKEFPKPESILSSGQIRRTLEIMFAVLDDIGSNITRGSFLLAGQKTNPDFEDLKRIVEFNLPSGKSHHYLGGERDSEMIAWNTINDASRHSRLQDEENPITYLEGTPIFLPLNTTNGRFLAAFFADGADYRTQTYIYATIAKTMALYYKVDGKLQESYRTLYEKELRHYSDLERIDKLVEELWNK